MRLAKSVFLTMLTILVMSFIVSAQTSRSEDDPRNTAPTVGTGGAVGGPTGLFTVYDGQTLRAGEFTFAAAYSNYDRDPGNVDFTEVPISFQVGLNDYVELFFSTEAYRQIKVNNPRNLSGFYLPNSRLPTLPASNAAFVQNGVLTSAPAIILAPRGATATNVNGSAVFRPQGSQPFVPFPFVGGSSGNFGFRTGTFSGPFFGFPAGTFPTLGPVQGSNGNGADLFPGIGSPVGGILPGIVLQFANLPSGSGTAVTAQPSVFTIAPSYLPDAPFLNRTYAQSAFGTFNVGAKIRLTGPDNPIGIGIIPFYRFYGDKANSASGFNQLNRGASPGGSRGDFGLVGFADARLASYLTLSGNIGYVYNSNPKSDFGGGTEFTLLDRPNELTGAIGIDVTPNENFQIIGEARALKYVGARTPNAFQQNPVDLIGGGRIFPTRYISLGAAFRYNVNQQDRDIFNDFTGQTNVITTGGATTTTNFNGNSPSGFSPSNDPYGFIFSASVGRRNSRKPREVINQRPVVSSLDVNKTEVVRGCPEGQTSPNASCGDTSVGVTTNATDAEGDTLLYNYTVSGGTVSGTGANVNWDLSGAQPGTYTISVAVEDGCAFCGTPTSKEVRVVECEGCKAEDVPPPCPTVSVSASPSSVLQSETVTFNADVNLQGTNPTYNWTVSAGEIESGQGTPSITVRAPMAVDASSITATVALGGLDATCPGTASATADITVPDEKPLARLVDRYGVENNDRSKTRLDALATELQSDPNARAVVIAYGREGKRGGNAEAERRLTFARNYLVKNRGVDEGRITTVNGGAAPSGAATELYVVPAGAEDPTANPQE